MMWAEPGMMPMRKPSTVPRPIGRDGLAPLPARGQQLAQARLLHQRRRGLARGDEHLGEPEKPHREGHHPEPVAQLDHAVGEPEIARHGIDAHHAEHEPEGGHGEGLEHGSPAHVREHEEAQEEEGEVLGRPQAEGEVGERRREQHQRDHRQRPRDEGADGGDGQRGARAALLRHRVAVDAGHHRRRLAGDAHEDRGGRAAVHRAVVDAGEEHDGAGGVEPEGGGQQEADPRQRAHAGQHAHEGADRQPDEGVEEHAGRERHAEAQGQVLQGLRHGGARAQSPSGPRGSGTLSSVLKRKKEPQATRHREGRRQQDPAPLHHARPGRAGSRARWADSRSARARGPGTTHAPTMTSARCAPPQPDRARAAGGRRPTATMATASASAVSARAVGMAARAGLAP